MLDLKQLETEVLDKTLDELGIGAENITAKLSELEMLGVMLASTGAPKDDPNMKRLAEAHAGLRKALAIISRALIIKGLALGKITQAEYDKMSEALNKAQVNSGLDEDKAA